MNSLFDLLLPPLSTEEFDALRADIKANGVLHPVFVDEDAATTRIKWDGHEIETWQLLKLLRFELNPDTLNDLDLRRHKREKITPLFDLS